MGIVVLADVRELHADLTRLLRLELDAGNLVDDTWRGWPKPNTICVKLARSFLPNTLVAGAMDSLVYSAVNDPHYWREQILHKPSGHMLVTGYDFEHRNAAT